MSLAVGHPLGDAADDRRLENRVRGRHLAPDPATPQGASLTAPPGAPPGAPPAAPPAAPPGASEAGEIAELIDSIPRGSARGRRSELAVEEVDLLAVHSDLRVGGKLPPPPNSCPRAWRRSPGNAASGATACACVPSARRPDARRAGICQVVPCPTGAARPDRPGHRGTSRAGDGPRRPADLHAGAETRPIPVACGATGTPSSTSDRTPPRRGTSTHGNRRARSGACGASGVGRVAPSAPRLWNLAA